MTNGYLVAAGCVALAVGLVHSVLGEILIFRRLSSRSGESGATFSLGRRHVRILRVTWHVTTLLGAALAVLLLAGGTGRVGSADWPLVEQVSAWTFLACSVVTLVGTRGRHPGWVGLLAVAMLIWLA